MSKRILIVDDEPEQVHLLSLFLRRAGFDTDCAYDGQQALAVIQRERPDLVLCDVMMPRLDGLQTLAAIRADPSTQSLPVILISASDDALGQATDADAFIRKPYRGRDLVATVQKHI
ncbi:MAG TPA: response regulator [Anaerolineae bacterium]|nr:response regulator [Anaerolineae bacterium]HIQ05519.1 response regulator [Anaerolineae bacterium]